METQDYSVPGQRMRARALGFRLDYVGGVPALPGYQAFAWAGSKGFGSPCDGASFVHERLADAMAEALDNALKDEPILEQTYMGTDESSIRRSEF